MNKIKRKKAKGYARVLRYQQRRTVMLETHVYERLKKYGKFGESYSDVISHILDKLEEWKEDQWLPTPDEIERNKLRSERLKKNDD